jgi:hypothetical protein
MKLALVLVVASCVRARPPNEATAQLHRSSWKAQVSAATFDGKLVRIALGPRISIVIASCYAHAEQHVGDHDHMQIELDGHAATAGELDITDCLTTHVIANLHVTFADGTTVDANLDTDLAKR